MPPLARSASLPTLLTLTRLFHAIPKRSEEWVFQAAASTPIEPEDPPDSPAFWWKLSLSVVFVLSGGVFAGLTLALMGSDDLNLRVLATSSSEPRERKAAAKVLKLLGRGRHWVLVVLLLSNVIVNESLPIFLDDVLGGGLYAVIVSTTMIVIFGEIIPQAVCVRYGLAIGGACAPMVWCFMILFSPIAWPTAKLLDYILGTDEGHTYKKAELKSFLQFHREGEEPLRDDEIGILNGVLSLNDKHAKEIMTPIKDCLTLPSDKVLDHESIDQILLSGFSRIPIHEPGQKDNFIGMLLVKRLITYNPDDEWPVSKFPLLPLPEAKPDINCFQALDYFQTGRAHLLLISETPGQKGGAIGIVSLEDLIEEIIGEEIVDETDRYEDNHSKKMAKRSGPAAVMRGIIERRRVINAFSRRPSRTNTSQTDSPNPNGGTQTNNTISLPGPGANGSTKGNNTQDGILIQIDNGNLVAEPVGFTGDTENSVSIDPSKRMTVSSGSASMETNNTEPISKQPENLMDTIEETSPISPSSGADAGQPRSPVSTTVEETKADVTIEVNDSEMLSPNPNDFDEGSGSGSGTVSGNVSEHDDATNGTNGDGVNGTGAGKKKKKKGKKGKKGGNADTDTDSRLPDKSARGSVDGPQLPFENHQAFSRACLAYLGRYEQSLGSVQQGGSSDRGGGRNDGWRWVQHQSAPDQGYLYRRLTKYIPIPIPIPVPIGNSSPDPSALTTRQIYSTHDTGDRRYRLGDDSEPAHHRGLPEQEEEEQEEEEEEMLEDVIDEAAALPLNMHHSIQAQAQAQTQAQTQSPTQTGHNTVQAAKVELEEYIIYSKIYGCPQFCFRAFDQTGAPLSNSQLLSLNFLKPDTNTTTTTTQSHYQSEDTPALGLLPDQGTSSPSPWPSAPSPPLLQSLELPSTGQLVLAINPTPILEGVNEIMQSGPRPQRQAHKDAHNHARGRNQHEDQSRSREGDEASQLESAVNWLECWLLLISNKVDLSYP